MKERKEQRQAESWKPELRESAPRPARLWAAGEGGRGARATRQQPSGPRGGEGASCVWWAQVRGQCQRGSDSHS